jgi:hypothetical protein
MPVQNPKHAKVKHTPISKNKVGDSVKKLDAIVSAGTQSADVQNSPIAKQALSDLAGAVTNLHGAMSSKESLALALAAATKALGIDVTAASSALRTYESAVNTVADGDASVINKAGLTARDEKTPPSALGVVTDVRSKPGKLVTEAIVSWPAVPGATSYAMEVNYTPSNPSGTYTALASGSSRRRTIKGPTPASQFLARVAAVASDGTQSDWSAPIVVTTR